MSERKEVTLVKPLAGPRPDASARGTQTASEGAGVGGGVLPVRAGQEQHWQQRKGEHFGEAPPAHMQRTSWLHLAKSFNSLMDKCSSEPHLSVSPHIPLKNRHGYLKV